MAADNTIGALFIELGLDISQLESDLINADRTVQQNMARLRRENTVIRLRAETEITGLDAAADATRIFEIRTQALNQQISNQRDRLRMAEAALEDTARQTGEHSDATQRASIVVERERLALARMERDLENLNDTQSETNESFADFAGRLGDMAGEFAPVLAGFGALIGAILEAGNASKELIEEWRELQTQAYKLNMSVNDTENFLRHMKLAGGEIDDFMGYIRGITDAWTKGEWDDPEFLTLRKYGADIVDVTGRLKNFEEITEEVYQAYLKAKAAGEEIEFLQLTGGESGVTDAIEYFERYAEAKEDAEKIFDAGLAPDEFHEAERALNLLTMQIGEFKDALVNVITPATVRTMEELFEVFNAGTEILVENKDAFQSLGYVVVGTVQDMLKAQINPVGGFYSQIRDMLNADELAEEATAKDREEQIQEVFKTSEGLERAHAKLKASLRGDPTTQYGWQRLTDLRDELKELDAEIENFGNDYQLALAQLDLWQEQAYRQNDISPKEREAIEDLFSAKLKQIAQEREAALDEIRANVAAEIDWSDLDKAFYDIQQDRKDWLSAGMDAAEADELAEQLKLNAIEELNEEFYSKLDEYRQNDLERQLAAIEEEKQAWIDKGIDEARATELAEQQKAEAIESLENEVAKKLNSIWQTELENRLDQIEREKQAWIDKGVDEVKATKWAEQAKVDAQRNAAMSVLKSQLEEYRSFQEGGYEGLRQYQLNQLYEAGIRPEDLKMTPQQLMDFQRARAVAEKSLLPNFMTDFDWAENAQQLSNSFANFQNKLRAEMQNIWDGIEFEGKPAEMSQEMEAGFGMLAQDALPEMAARSKELAAELENLGMAIESMPEITVPEVPSYQMPETQPPSLPTEPVMPELPEMTIPFDVDAISAKFEELVSPMEELDGELAEMSLQLTEVTDGLSELNQALHKIFLPRLSDSGTEKSVPPQINVTISIEEAHAWDSEHIQELADKVADAITPAITNAIGGNANAY